MANDNIKRLRGEVEIWGINEKNEVFYHEKDHNIVTKWAKHSVAHLLTSESFSSHGNRTVWAGDGTNTVTALSSRSITASDHIEEDIGNGIQGVNNDGTLLSGKKYLGNNDGYFGKESSTSKNYFSINNIITKSTSDSTDDIIYPYFPTKILFGTGIEYKDWDAVVDAGRGGTGQDGYQHPDNGGWNETQFNLGLNTSDINVSIIQSNYYSATFDETETDYKKRLVRTRTVNDIYSSSLTDELTEEVFGIKGAVKTVFNGSNTDILEEKNSKYFIKKPYNGLGYPSFIYPHVDDQHRPYTSASDVYLSQGDSDDSIESKITYTFTLPKQENGEYYPYNGYMLKQIGLFCDSAFVLGNIVPDGDDSNVVVRDLNNYHKMPSGILWAARNISPITKSHSTEIIVKWTIYF